MPRVYIAGPMRGFKELNFPAFDRAASLGRSLGWDVISPADMDREAGTSLDPAQHSITPALLREIVGRDTKAILSLRAEDGDAIALLPGWSGSTGAKAELAMAVWLGLKVLNALSFTPLDAVVSGASVMSDNPPLPAEFACATGSCRRPDYDAEERAVRMIADDFANRERV